MTTSAPGVPTGYHSVNPYLIVHDGAAALTFYAEAFGATIRMRHADEGGRIMHAELEIGDSVVMLAHENPAMSALSPKALTGSPVHMLMYVADVDAAFARAVAAGATPMGDVADRPYGDRVGTVTDPFGHVWYINTRIDDAARTDPGQL